MTIYGIGDIMVKCQALQDCGDKNVNKVEVVKRDESTHQKCSKTVHYLFVSAPAKENGTANAGDYKPSHFVDEFNANMVKTTQIKAFCRHAELQIIRIQQAARQQQR